MSQVVLALDTSTPVLSAALLELNDGGLRVLARRDAGPPAITSTLVPSVFDEMLEETGRRLGDVDILVAGLGPGLFTGVRVAVATMKAIAYARRRPLLGAQSLAAMAHEASVHVSEGELLCPVLDARKGEVYWSLYERRDGMLSCRLPPEATTRVALLARLGELNSSVRLFGTGTLGIESSPTIKLLAAPRTPAASEIAKLALAAEPVPVFDAAAVLALEPFYLRPPEAEVARKRREGLPTADL